MWLQINRILGGELQHQGQARRCLIVTDLYWSDSSLIRDDAVGHPVKADTLKFVGTIGFLMEEQMTEPVDVQ